ncbi:hypothetical protein ACEWY4_009178 [Coilia grayii]|uniref:Zinc finger protein n=1 Tax=Coilia grayii TaxID=363190 RepID=A0ABD1K5T3_9TELE
MTDSVFPETCALCMDTLRDPVTIPCGDTYCLECIKIYWDQYDHIGVYSCAQCRATFTPRPVLRRNMPNVGSPDPRDPQPLPELTPFPYLKRDSLCDFCTGRRNRAVKSCLVCLAYYCETHIKPHYESATFKRHKLVDETGHLDRKICPQHEKGLELFCRSDQMCICVLCTVREHRSHNIVSAEEERADKQKVLVITQSDVQHIIQERMKELQELRHNVEVLKGNAHRAQGDSDKIFSEMLQAVERWHAEISQLIQANLQASMAQAQGYVERLEQEIMELQRRDSELRQILDTEDNIHFLQNFPTLSVPPEPMVPKVLINPEFSFGEVTKTVTDMKEHLDDICKKEVGKISKTVSDTPVYVLIPRSGGRLKAPTRTDFQQPKHRSDFLRYSSSLTFDQNTAYKELALTDSGRKVVRKKTVQLIQRLFLSMDVMHCVRSLMELQSQLQRAIAMQEDIQNEMLAHLLRPQPTRLNIPKGYEAGEDIEACFAAFERAACAHNVPRWKWGRKMMKLLGMNQIEEQNPSLQDNEYEVVKDSLRSQARMLEEQWQVNFTLASFDSLKGPRELGQGLDEAARRWLKPERRSAVEVVQRVALHKFVTLLPKAASDWVMQHQPNDMEQAISLAEQFLEMRNEEKYREMDKEVTGEQYTVDSSESSGTSEIRITQNHTPWITAPKEETSLRLCQSVSLNVKVEGLEEIYLEEEAGNEPNELDTAKQQPVEENYCSVGVLIESPSFPAAQSSVTTSVAQPVMRPSTRVKNISSCTNEAAPKRGHACPHCGKSYTSLLHLRRHSCHQTLFACQKCEATFSSQSQLAQHRRIHRKVLNCPYCGRLFRDKFNLRNHVRTHTGERPYRCQDCGDTFAQEKGMLEHRNIHTGQRPFVCPQCGKGFSHSRTLSKHRQLHSDLRPYFCTLCGKTFKIKDNLKRHQLVHDKNRKKL